MSDCTCVVCSISSKWEIFSTSIGTGFRACQKCQQHQKVKIENETTWLVVEPYPSEK
jgi:methylphosphotriester-DNA--protein-cysteine methyltransferase